MDECLEFSEECLEKLHSISEENDKFFFNYVNLCFTREDIGYCLWREYNNVYRIEYNDYYEDDVDLMHEILNVRDFLLVCKKEVISNVLSDVLVDILDDNYPRKYSRYDYIVNKIKTIPEAKNINIEKCKILFRAITLLIEYVIYEGWKRYGYDED